MERMFDINKIPKQILGVTLSDYERENLSKGLTSFYHEGFYDGKNVVNGKIWLTTNEDGEIEVKLKKKEHIIEIPNKINVNGINHELTEDEKHKLSLGLPIELKNRDGSTVKVMIDKELNTISFFTNENVKDILLDKYYKFGHLTISGYTLSEKEFKDLLEGKSLGPKVFEENGNFFVCSISINKNELIYHDIVDVSKETALQLQKELNSKSEIDKGLDQSKPNTQSISESNQRDIIESHNTTQKTDTRILVNEEGQVSHRDTVEQVNKVENIVNTENNKSFEVSDNFKNCIDNYNIQSLAEQKNNGHSLSDNEISYVLNSNLSYEQKSTILNMFDIPDSKINQVIEKFDIENSEFKFVHSPDEKAKPGKSLHQTANLIRSAFDNM